MRDQPRLLKMIIKNWDPNIETFILDGMPLKLEVENIYFITELSHLGEVVTLRDRGAGGGMSIDEYIDMY